MLMVRDEAKRAKNLQAEPEGHGLDFADARDRFEWETARIGEAKASEAEGRKRCSAIGFLDGELVTLIFSLLGSEAISAVSLRHASRSERKLYGKS